MAARPRAPKNRALPDNLYPNGKYWVYRNPITGKRTSINRPLADAVKLARAANAKLAPLMADDGALLALITGDQAPTFEHLIDRFEAEWLPGRDYAASTLEEITFKLNRYRQDLGKRMIGQLDVLGIAEYLDGFSNNAYTKHRGLLVQLFAFAVAKGLTERNVAELTLVKKEAEKQRQRHTLEGLTKIIEHPETPAWLSRAIRLSLITLLRREDVVTLRRDAVDLAKGTIRVSPGKSEKYSTPIHLEIQMGGALREVVHECMRSAIVSPFLIHYRPKARKREQLDAKEHWTAVTPDYLTKEFSRVRDLVGAYNHIPAGQRPTFHEVRALGSWLYDQQQFQEEYVQALMGHADPKMTRHYQEGHGEQVIEYQVVGADLKL